MSDPSPWDAIPTPKADFNVRLVAARTAIPCFWGRDTTGACIFIVELKGDHRNQFRKEQIRLRGIGVDLRSDEGGEQRLVLTLEEQVDRDLFEGLCNTLAIALTHSTDSESSLAIALAHLRRWKRFLSGSSQRLSPEEVRGLYGEISFLLELLDHGMSDVDAVSAWRGPERSQQDFIFGDSAVEIKSLAGTERSMVRISSEDQLEPLQDKLYLRIYRLSDLPDATNARTLNGIVEAAYAVLADSDAVDALDRKLAAYGYVPLPEYDKPSFVVSAVLTYHVHGEFPRLVRSGLANGIDRVSYDIRLEAIEPFKRDDTCVFGDA
jgi:hypothetical protein